jgi:hypothetical protein
MLRSGTPHVVCLTIITASCAVIKSRLPGFFNPIRLSAWVDWLLPPETIVHEVNSKDGRVKRNANEFREIFTMSSFMLEKAHLAKDNTHKYAARRRLAAVSMAHAIAKRLGMPIHDEEMSRRSAKLNINGTRTLLCAKDACSYVAKDLKYERIKTGSLVTHIDTFTHKDFRDANDTLSDGNIHFIYTWNPEEVAGTSDELKFRYDDEGNFITEVDGSAPYCDRLWDFEDDCLVTHSYEASFGCITAASLLAAMSICCSTLTNGAIGLGTLCRNCLATGAMLSLAAVGYYTPITMCHKVIRLDVGKHRSIVVVVPNCKFRGFASSFRPFLTSANYEVIHYNRRAEMSRRMDGRQLRPRIPTVGITDGGHKFLAEKRKNPSGFSVAFVGSYNSYFVPDAVYDMTKSLTTGKGLPSLSNVRVSSKNEGDETHRVAVALAIAMANKEDQIQTYSSNYGYYPLPTIIRQDDDSKADGDPIKEVMAHGAMPPIVTGGAYIHARSEAQTRDFVKRRLKDPAAKVDSSITPEVAMYIKEFADNIVKEIGGKPGHLDPISEQEYIDSRNKSQLNKFHDIVNIYDIHNYDDRKGFMKREVLSDPTKAARGICTFKPESQALGGRIALAYAAAMKACPWMACGLNPAETQEAVVRVCVGKGSITDTDFSAQDATIDKNKRCVELMLLLQLFDDEWHTLIKDWHYTDYCGRVLYGDPGTKREPHEFNGSRGSGSPFTTLGNTPLTGLFAYVALRLAGNLPDAAWSKLGIYSGDDGITADLPPAFCDQAAEFLGFLVKSASSTKYIPFLGRTYFDPIGGSTSSIQSPLRTLSKLHTTLLNIQEFTAEEAMIMKAICLQVTDKDSDFFGAWSKKVLEDADKKQANYVQSLGAKILKYPGLHPYFAITALKSQTTFHNSPGDFEELFEIEMPGFDWSKFKEWLSDGTGPCPTLWELPEPSDAAMEAVGPVTLAMGGVDDEANFVEYMSPSKSALLAMEELQNANSAASFAKQQRKKVSWEGQKDDSRSGKPKPSPEKGEAKQQPRQPSQPPENGAGSSRKRRSRTPAEQKLFLGQLEALGLLEAYRAAKIESTDPPDVQKEKRKVRNQIARKVNPVHKPRSQ